MYSIVFNFLFILLSYLYFLRYDKKDKTYFVFTLALTLRLIFSVFNVTGIDFPGVNSTDIGRFIATAHQVQTMGLSGNFDITQSYVWSWVLGLVMMISRDTVFAPLVFNSLLGTLAVLSLYRTALFLGTSGSAKMSAWLIALCPPLVFYSAVLLRETILLLLLAQLFYYVVYIYKMNAFNMINTTKMLLFYILLVVFHGAFAILIFPIILTMVYPVFSGRVKILSGNFFIAFILFPILLISLSYYFIQMEIGHSKLYFLYGSSGGLELVGNAIGFMARRAQNSELISWTSGGSLLANVLELNIKTLFGPFFAGEYRNFDIVRMVIVVYVNFNLLLITGKAVFSSGITRIGLAFILIIIVGFAVISGYYEHAFRHYLKAAPLIIVMGTPMVYGFLTELARKNKSVA